MFPVHQIETPKMTMDSSDPATGNIAVEWCFPVVEWFYIGEQQATDL